MWVPNFRSLVFHWVMGSRTNQVIDEHITSNTYRLRALRGFEKQKKHENILIVMGSPNTPNYVHKSLGKHFKLIF